MDPACPTVEALATRDRRIVARGSEDDVRAAVGEGAQIVDLAGGCLCPGFIDAHHHFGIAALLRQAVRLNQPQINTVDRFVQALRQRARQTPPGQWILGMGHDELRLREKRLPRQDELDDACPDHPVLAMHFGLHDGVANSRAFEAAGFCGGGRELPRGEVVRNRRGQPTGLLLEEAASRVLIVAMDQIISDDTDAYLSAVSAYEQELLSYGIVRVFDPGVHPALEAVLSQAHDTGKLRLGVHMMVVGDKGYLTMPLERLDGSTTGEGSEQLRVGPLKIFMDGGKLIGVRLGFRQVVASLASATRHALSSGSLDGFRVGRDATIRPGWDGKLHCGMLFYQVEQARSLFERAQACGFSVAVHAMGNEAIARALEALPDSPAQRPPGVGPHRIEHFFMPEPGHPQRAAQRGIAASVQPGFIPMVADRLFATGFPAPDRTLPLRQMLDAGMCLAGSSDAPVDDPSPLHGMWAACARRTTTGELFGGAQRIQPEEALALYTRGAAIAGGIEDSCGSLTEAAAR